MRRVTAAVIIEDGRLFLARRAPADRLAGLWELPGGKVEPGETAEACLARELLEELEMVADIGELLASTVFQYPHGRFEMLALRTSRLSGYCLCTHDACAWVRPDDLHEHPLAPADVELVAQLVSRGHWG